MDDETYLAHVADTLAALPAVEAVALGGSRAQGTPQPGSDWDFALYYRGSFDPGDLRAVGWPGEVSGIGEWGGGVFNGGAWLTVDGRRTDVHYRDLDVVERETAKAQQGLFHQEQLMFHLAGIPSYLVVAELALNRVLRGELPRPAYPSALRTAASARWRETARHTLSYARAAHAPRGARAEVAGSVAVAARTAGARRPRGARRVVHERQGAAGPGRTARNRRHPGVRGRRPRRARGGRGRGAGALRLRTAGLSRRPRDEAAPRHRPQGCETALNP